MKLEKDFSIDAVSGALRLTYHVTDLGRHPSVHVSALIGDPYRGVCAPVAVVKDMQHQLEREIGRQLFGP